MTAFEVSYLPILSVTENEELIEVLCEVTSSALCVCVCVHVCLYVQRMPDQRSLSPSVGAQAHNEFTQVSTRLIVSRSVRTVEHHSYVCLLVSTKLFTCRTCLLTHLGLAFPEVKHTRTNPNVLS